MVVSDKRETFSGRTKGFLIDVKPRVFHLNKKNGDMCMYASMNKSTSCQTAAIAVKLIHKRTE